MKKDRESNRHKPHMNNSTEDKDQESNKELLKIKNPEGEKEKYKDSKKHLPNIRNNVGKKENNSSNETKGSNMPVTDIRKKNHTETSQDTKKQKAAIRQLLCELFNISKESEACKEKHHSKKAMIWPTKMIPWLKKVLITKLNRGLNNRMSFLDKMEDPTESPFGGGSPNSLSDNWDGNPFLNMPRKHRNGLKMVPLLKTLKAKLYGQRTPGDFGNLNDALNGEGLNGFGPVPTQGSSHLMHQILSQALGRSDRNSVLNEMMQEFLLANNREESEGNEGFADLTAGTNSFSQFNNGLQQQSSPILPEPNQGIGFGQLGGMNMLQGNIRTPMASEQPIHAQMLDNGAIAPMSSQSIGNSPLKPASFLGGRSPIGRSPLIGSPLIGSPLSMSSMPISPISSPTSRSPQLQSSVMEDAPQPGGSLLERAGGFDSPISSSVLQRAANPTQRMYTESEGEEQALSSPEDSFMERSEADVRPPPERRLPLRRQPFGRQPLGNNMVMEEISDNMARGVRLPMQSNPDLNHLLKLRSNFRSSGRPSISRLSRLGLDNDIEHGLRLPVASNTMGMASVLSKDEDSLNLEDLSNERSLAFRRGKVLKGANNSHLLPKKSPTHHDKETKAKKSGV